MIETKSSTVVVFETETSICKDKQSCYERQDIIGSIMLIYQNDFMRIGVQKKKVLLNNPCLQAFYM